MPRGRFSSRYKLPAAPAAPVLPDMARENAINARVGQIPLQNEVREAQLARAQAAESNARYNLTKKIETDRQRTAFYNGLEELETNLNKQGMGIGTRGHAEAFAAYAHEFPLARSSADVQQALKLHSLVADDQAALKARMLEMMPPPEKIAQRYARVQGDIKGFQDLSKVEEAANVSKKLADVPFSKAPDLHAAQREAELLERSYPQLRPQQTTETNQAVVTPTVSPATQAPVFTPSPSPEATATQTQTPTHLGRYNPDTGEFE